MPKVNPLFFHYFTKSIGLNPNKIRVLLLLLVISGASSCSFRYYRVKANLGSTDNHIAHFVLTTKDDSKLPVWIKGNPSSEELIIFLAGGPGSPSLDYQPYLKELEKRYLLCYYDQRGAGFSKSKEKNLRIENYQLDLEMLVSRLKIAYPNKKFVLFGHSWGGFLAIKYLSSVREEEAFSRLIIMDGVHNFPLAFQSQKSSIIEVGNKMLLSESDSLSKIKIQKILDETKSKEPSKLADCFRINENAYYLIRLQKLPLDKKVQKPKRSFDLDFMFVAQRDKVQENSNFGNELIKANLKDELKQIKIPTLLIWGDNDLVSNPTIVMRDMKENLSNVPSLDAVIIEKSGHTPIFYENNQMVINKINQFIERPNQKTQ